MLISPLPSYPVLCLCLVWLEVDVLALLQHVIQQHEHVTTTTLLLPIISTLIHTSTHQHETH